MVKKILMLSHQMSRTGAVIALFKMAEVLRKAGNEIMVLSVEEGPMMEDFGKSNIDVAICGKYFLYPEGFKKIAMQYDVVVANTILNFPAPIILNRTDIKVVWWIHEHQAYFDYGKGEIPDPHIFASNVIVCAAGKYVQRVIKNNFNYNAECLNIGVEEIILNSDFHKEDTQRKIKFLVVGTFGMEKGQDVVLEALEKIDTKIFQKLQVIMVGDFIGKDERLFERLTVFSKETGRLELRDVMRQEELYELYKNIDCVIVSSRNETLSMVGVEAMMQKIPVIVSSGAGLSMYIEEGINGYVFQNENSSMLSDRMEKIVEQGQDVKQIGEKGYQIFKDNFSIEAFEKNLREVLEG